METLHMQDVIRLLGLPAPPAGKSSYYIPCPCCDDKPKSRHLNINLQKNVFRCPRCGFSGGVLDLYAVFAGVPREEAYKALAGKRTFRAPAPREEKKPQAEENPLLDVDARHATYQALLSRLSLATDHRENLLSRGLTQEEILRLGYKTTPVLGFTALPNTSGKRAAMWQVCQASTKSRTSGR